MDRRITLSALSVLIATSLSAGVPPANPALPSVDPPVAPKAERYGDGAFERLEVVISPTPRPLMVIVDDSGLASLAGLGTGYLIRSLSRDYTVAVIGTSDPLYHGLKTRRDELAEALGYLLGQAVRLRIDTARIVLIGDGDGAGAIVNFACDRESRRRSGIAADALRGVVLVDGFGMDPVAERANASALVRNHLDRAGAATMAIDAKACPATPFRLITVTSRGKRIAMNDAFARLLVDAGLAVSWDSLPTPDAQNSTSWFGNSINRATRALLDWIAKQL